MTFTEEIVSSSLNEETFNLSRYRLKHLQSRHCGVSDVILQSRAEYLAQKKGLDSFMSSTFRKGIRSDELFNCWKKVLEENLSYLSKALENPTFHPRIDLYADMGIPMGHAMTSEGEKFTDLTWVKVVVDQASFPLEAFATMYPTQPPPEDWAEDL